MEDLNKRLENASKRRDMLASESRRIEGRLEAAEANLFAVEEECRAKGIDPTNIEAVISRLKSKYEDLVTQIEREVTSADKALDPFLKELNS